jgi:hypothetical protein
MVDDLIERVARAIADANSENYDELPHLHTALARAAIAAMREPTEAMVSAGNAAQTEEWGEQVAMDSRVPWRTMIDAAIASNRP